MELRLWGKTSGNRKWFIGWYLVGQEVYPAGTTVKQALTKLADEGKLYAFHFPPFREWLAGSADAGEGEVLEGYNPIVTYKVVPTSAPTKIGELKQETLVE